MPSNDLHSAPSTANASAPFALEVRDLAFSHGGFDVFRDVSFSLKAGELSFLMGGRTDPVNRRCSDALRDGRIRQGASSFSKALRSTHRIAVSAAKWLSFRTALLSMTI